MRAVVQPVPEIRVDLPLPLPPPPFSRDLRSRMEVLQPSWHIDLVVQKAKPTCKNRISFILVLGVSSLFELALPGKPTAVCF